jgi:hypothetical protein
LLACRREDQGRRLSHDFVVTTLTKCRLKADRDLAWWQIFLDEAAKGPVDGLALAVWVTRSGSLEPLQTVDGRLRCGSSVRL